AILSQHEVGQAFAMDIQRAGGNLMERGLPDMAVGLVDQQHMVGAEFSSQLGGKLQSACAAADNDYSVFIDIRHCCSLLCYWRHIADRPYMKAQTKPSLPHEYHGCPGSGEKICYMAIDAAAESCAVQPPPSALYKATSLLNCARRSCTSCCCEL